MIKSIITGISILFAVIGVKAQSVDEAFYALPSDGMSQLTARMFTDYQEVEKGEEFKLAVYFDLDHGWYTYTGEETGKNLPTSIELTLPKGFSIVKTEWPKPMIVPSSKGGTDKVYKRDFMVVYTIKAGKKKTTEELKAQLKWQVCDPTICMIGEASLSTSLKVGKQVKSNLYDVIHKK